MKRIKYSSLVLFLASLMIWGCDQNESKLYTGPSQIHFIEDQGSLIINNTNPLYTIQVGVSKPVDQERTFEVVIDEENSSATEGVSFELISNQVIIPAGEVLGNIEVKGLFEGAEPNGVVLKLALSTTNQEEVATFKNSFELNLFKFCDFNRDAFIGTYHVYEHAYNGEYEYDVVITEGDDPYSVFVDGLWDVPGSKVKISFDRRETDCHIPAQFFFNDPGLGYDNAWIRSLSDGTYNTCLGSIENLEYFVYPEDSPNQGWDRGTFDMYKIME